MEKYLVLGNLLINIISIGVLTYLHIKVYYMEKFLNSLPTKEEIIKEIISTKVPMMVGPDGQPIMPGMTPPKPEPNPLVG